MTRMVRIHDVPTVALESFIVSQRKRRRCMRHVITLAVNEMASISSHLVPEATVYTCMSHTIQFVCFQKEKRAVEIRRQIWVLFCLGHLSICLYLLVLALSQKMLTRRHEGKI